MTPTFLGARKELTRSKSEECVFDDGLRVQYFEFEAPVACSSLKRRREFDVE